MEQAVIDAAWYIGVKEASKPMADGEDFELTLFDRVNAIRDTIEKNGEGNFYLSYSGGKDSTVLHHLIDIALPGNRIPRVFVNTGVEYVDIVKYVKAQAAKDGRFVLIPPKRPIREVLGEYGYPFKSKVHSHYLGYYQKNGRNRYVSNYLGEGSNVRFLCPECLKYQFSPGFPLKVSDACCRKLKKEPARDWAKANGRPIAITGMREGEGGVRASNGKSGCAVFDGKGSLRKFHPLKPVSSGFEDWFLKREGIKLCRLYYPPFSFERTGCKGCPFAISLEDELEAMERYLPSEWKQCEALWAPVYDEYRRLGYRLKPAMQMRLF